MQNPESVLENDHTRDGKKKKVKRKKKTSQIVDFTVLTDHREKNKSKRKER